MIISVKLCIKLKRAKIVFIKNESMDMVGWDVTFLLNHILSGLNINKYKWTQHNC